MIKMAKKRRDLGLDVLPKNYEEEDKIEDPFVSKEPTTDEPERPQVNQLDYHTSLPETVKLFEVEGLSLGAVNAELSISGSPPIADKIPYRRFFARLDTTKQDLETHITSMHRFKAYDYKTDKKGKTIKTIKEFLYYHLELRGVDWLNIPMMVTIENEGIAEKPAMTIDQKFDPNTGRSIVTKRFIEKTEQRYYIPFSPKTIKEIIDKFNNGNTDDIKFYGEIPRSSHQLSRDFRYDGYSYDEFVNTDWNEFEKIARNVKNKEDIDRQNKAIANLARS